MTGRAILLSAQLVLTACTTNEEVARFTPLLLGRYWLEGMHLGPHDGITPLGPPILVEVYFDRTARSVDNPSVRGPLPPDALIQPGHLHLYASTEAPIHAEAPDGPIIGTLHRGALVPVAPLRLPGEISLHGPEVYARLFVSPDVLTSEPPVAQPAPRSFPEGTRVSRWLSLVPGDTKKLHASSASGGRVCFGAASCIAEVARFFE